MKKIMIVVVMAVCSGSVYASKMLPVDNDAFVCFIATADTKGSDKIYCYVESEIYYEQGGQNRSTWLYTPSESDGVVVSEFNIKVDCLYGDIRFVTKAGKPVIGTNVKDSFLHGVRAKKWSLSRNMCIQTPLTNEQIGK
jgi:hypothetical protein